MAIGYAPRPDTTWTKFIQLSPGRVKYEITKALALEAERSIEPIQRKEKWTFWTIAALSGQAFAAGSILVRSVT